MVWFPEPTTKFSEAELQTAVAVYLDDLERLGQLVWFHPPNGSKRTKRAGDKLKAQGMKAGEPDCVIFPKTGGVILIELKTAKGNLQPPQKARHRLYKAIGYDVHVVKTDSPRGATKAVEDILRAAGVKI